MYCIGLATVFCVLFGYWCHTDITHLFISTPQISYNNFAIYYLLKWYNLSIKVNNIFQEPVQFKKEREIYESVVWDTSVKVMVTFYEIN